MYTSPNIKKRKISELVFLSIITLGFYELYWLYQTKNEINSLGGKIPSFILIVIPLANLYFYFRYAQDFVKYVLNKQDDDDDLYIIGYFLLFIVTLPPFISIIRMFFIQKYLNKLAQP